MSGKENQSGSKNVLPFLGLACGVGVSTIYYNQPLLMEIGRSFGADSGHAGMVAVATQVGYAAGLLFFVPMGDITERRTLMMRLYGGVTIALLLVAFAPTLNLMITASVLAGALAAVTHIALPIAPDLAPRGKGGRAIGVVMSGLLLGVLLARTFSGWISEISNHFFRFAGWRSVFFVAALINAAFVPAIRRFMPLLPPKKAMSYGYAMRSLWTVLRDEKLLRESCLMGALMFATFSSFWNTLAFLLGTHGVGEGIAGSFGLVGTAGALVASWAGRQSDRKGPRWVLSIGLTIFAVAFAGLWLTEGLHTPLLIHLIIMAVFVVLLDTGMQVVQISNQTRIFSLLPEARSRLNTVYMVTYFAGGAIGSALSTFAWSHWRWNGVCTLALCLIGCAALRHAMGDKTKHVPPMPTDPNFEFSAEG